jgi:hypothetical protein
MKAVFLFPPRSFTLGTRARRSKRPCDNKPLSGALAGLTAASRRDPELAVWFALHTWFRSAVPIGAHGIGFDMPVLSSVNTRALLLPLGHDVRNLPIKGRHDAGDGRLLGRRHRALPGWSSIAMRQLLPTLILVVGGTLMPGAALAQIDIAAMPTGEVPPGFTTWRTGQGEAAAWQVVADPTAAGGKAIAQTSKDKTDYRFPLAVYQPVSARNVEVTLRFKPVAGTIDQAGGIALRLATPDDYYVLRANALEDNVRFYRVVKGRREQLESANAKVRSGEWHTLGLRADDDKFSVWFDGKPLFTAADQTFIGAGKVALWTKADSVTHFDTIAITPLP